MTVEQKIRSWKRPIKVGLVTSDKMDKTVVVKVERLVQHPLYGKYVRHYTVIKVHDPDNTARVGDRVEVEFCRPLSKTKRWRLVRVVRPARSAKPSAAEAIDAGRLEDSSDVAATEADGSDAAQPGEEQGASS